MSTPNKHTLKSYSSDLLALEKHLLNAVKQQKTSDKITDEEAIEVLHQLDKTLSLHVTNLEKEVDRLGGKLPSDLKSKVASFAGSLAGLIDSARKDPASKMMRDNYAALSMITIGYTMLHTLALAAEDPIMIELTENNLADCTIYITEISKVVPLVVARESVEDSDKAEEVGKEALKNTQAAWKPEHVNSGPGIVE